MADSEAHSGDLDGTSPDLLKNTPANIAKLVDVIEQCKGRHKYLAQTRSPSDGSDVRWYFSKVSLAENELAASVPRNEIVGKSEYFRFGMRDSLAIEASFLQREEELLSLWWKEYAESSEGPKLQINSEKKSDKQRNAPSDGCASTRCNEIEEERVGVPVKGGLYEVDLVRRHCFPVYWSGDDRRILRGHWFASKGSLDWLPIREDVAEQLEVAYHNKVWHRRRFQLSGLFAARVDLQGSSPGLHALFTGEDDTWEAWLNVDPSGFSGIIGYSGYGFKLRRGYSGSQTSKPSKEELRQRKEEDMDDYCSQVPVRHLVFMVHGIGQRLEKSNFVDDVGNFHKITASLAERHLTSYQRGTQRVLFIPCQWRKGLKLSGEAAVEKCTLDGVRSLRLMLSATSHDILYYMSPIYCQDIIDSVSNQLNRLYLKFKKRNPGYDGKVSLYGHSLGSVLSYDILCHQENLSSPFPMDSIYTDSSTNEGSFPQRSFWSSTPESTREVEATKSDRRNGTYKFFNQVDEDMTTSEQTVPEHKEAKAEDSSIFNSVSTDFDVIRNMNLETICSKKDISSHSKDTIDEQKVWDSLGGAKSEYQELPHSDGKIKAEENSKNGSDEDERIKFLREEIDSLKAKLVQLESQTGRTASDDKPFPEKANMLASAKQLVSKIPSLSNEEEGGALKSYTPYIKYTKLEFEVDTFFAVGSPLGVFLALRNIRLGIGKGKDYWMAETITEEMPACRRIFNIFHPFDPVAYRIEPLICKEYINKQPVIVPYHKGGRRLHIGFQEFTEDLSARSQAIIDHFDAARIRVLTVCQSRSKDELEDGSETVEEKEERSYGSLMMERLTGSKDGRIDHVLQDKTFEHTYLQAIGSHTNYWRDYDTALFILRHLYRDISEDLVSFEDSSAGLKSS